jgi:hypothetical protein
MDDVILGVAFVFAFAGVQFAIFFALLVFAFALVLIAEVVTRWLGLHPSQRNKGSQP